MLAFEVSVTLYSEQGVRNVARWLAEPSFLSTIREYMMTGDIEVVSLTGGYPDVYNIYGPLIVDWLTEDAPELQVHWAGRVHINHEALDLVERNQLNLRLSIWDQS